jgi:5-formaminoimidazole-4-carboxamide-1-beta-D-ribofuranosyl 5'-monophosphate synthetase
MSAPAIRYVGVRIDGHAPRIDGGTAVYVDGVRLECASAADADRMMEVFRRLGSEIRAEHQHLRAMHERALAGRVT